MSKAPGTVFRDDGCPGGCPLVVALPRGAYLRGTPDGQQSGSFNEGPQKTVTIDYDLAVGRTEITRDQFEAFVIATDYKVADQCDIWTGTHVKVQQGSFRKPGFDQNGSHPAVCISWDEATSYAAWLAKITGKPYRLLSEAEWEYAARGVTWATLQPRNPWGDDAKQVCTYANGADITANTQFKDSSGAADCHDGYVFTAPIGSFQPNAFGLYDTLGNVWEFVHDCYVHDYNNAPVDGSAAKDWSSTCERTVRGGALNFGPRMLCPACRTTVSSNARTYNAGFRVGRRLSGT